MKIPVFVSAPTALSAEQQSSYDAIVGILESLNLERRALGRSDYPTEFPLKEVFQLARRCSGGVILGFAQQRAPRVVAKLGTSEEKTLRNVAYPSPWNQLEAGILFSLRLPLMVFRESGVTGGVFDTGVTDVFIHPIPVGDHARVDNPALREVILAWQARVRQHYYDWR
jgi:hypothetical protein